MRRTCYLPEGVGPLFPDHQSLAAIREAMESQTVLEGMAVRCDSQRDLHIRFGGWEGVIPRQEAAAVFLTNQAASPAAATQAGARGRLPSKRAARAAQIQ